MYSRLSILRKRGRGGREGTGGVYTRFLFLCMYKPIHELGWGREGGREGGKLEERGQGRNKRDSGIRTCTCHVSISFSCTCIFNPYMNEGGKGGIVFQLLYIHGDKPTARTG